MHVSHILSPSSMPPRTSLTLSSSNFTSFSQQVSTRNSFLAGVGLCVHFSVSVLGSYLVWTCAETLGFYCLLHNVYWKQDTSALLFTMLQCFLLINVSLCMCIFWLSMEVSSSRLIIANQLFRDRARCHLYQRSPFGHTSTQTFWSQGFSMFYHGCFNCYFIMKY